MADLKNRRARCPHCLKTVPSAATLAFFEFRGEGSRTAVQHCACGMTLACHDQPRVAEACAKDRPAPIARGPMEFDSYYCGCRGWD